MIYVFTHDSIGVGEDGPTHQPVEQLARCAHPRPDHVAAGRCQRSRRSVARGMRLKHQPACLVLSRQPLPTLDRHALCPGRGVWRGAYVLADPATANPR